MRAGGQPQAEGDGWALTSFWLGAYHTPGTVPGTGLSSGAGRSRTAFLQQSSFPELKAQITFFPKSKAPESGTSSVQEPGARFKPHAGHREQPGTSGVAPSPGELGSPGEAETCPCLSFPVRRMWVGLSSAQERNCSGAAGSRRELRHPDPAGSSRVSASFWEFTHPWSGASSSGARQRSSAKAAQ